VGDDQVVSVTEMYVRFADYEANGNSPLYREWALGVATDPELEGLIADLPNGRQQPNLIFAAARLSGSPIAPFPQFRDWLLAHWHDVKAQALTRTTQTNEPGRCAVLLPLLAALPQPLAVVEVGASAGLCLYPDRYSYRYNNGDFLDPSAGRSKVELACSTTGPVPFPSRLPEVVWRSGIDLNPLDVHSADDTRWLRALVWPEQTDRLQRLDAAISIAQSDPAQVVRGDLNSALVELAMQAPAGATLVVFHSAVLSYLPNDDRQRFVATVGGLHGHWISNEGPSVLNFADPLPPSPDPSKALTVVALDGHPIAYAGSHGQTLHWNQ
jgi:hypothetical protein